MKYNKIKIIDDFATMEYAINNYKSILFNNKPLSVAFIQNWSYRLLKIHMEAKRLYIYEKSEVKNEI